GPAAAVAAAEIGEGHRLGRLHHISRGGALGAGAAQNLGLVGIHSGHQDGVLVGLRGGQLETLVLVLQAADVILVHGVQNGPGVGVLVVDDVPGALVDRTAGVAGLGGEIVPDALDGVLGGGRLGRHVVIHPVNGPLGGAAAVLQLVAQVADGGVHTMEPVIDGVGQGVGAVTDAVLDAVDAGLEVVQREAIVDVRARSVPLNARAIRTAEAAAKIAVAAPTEHTEDQEKDDPRRPVAAPHGAAAVAIAVAR